MDITRVEDMAALQDFHLVESASQDHDYVALPADPVEEYLSSLSGQATAGELRTLFLGREEGVPVGVLQMTIPVLDNLTSANISINVHPAHRRRGHGRELLRFALDQMQRHGRTRMFAEVSHLLDGGQGRAVGLMKEFGARPVLDDYRRLLDLTALPLVPRAAVPDGYRVVQWEDVAPEDLVDGLAYLLGRMSTDAPMGEMDYEQELWDAARYREREQESQVCGRRRIATAVVHESGQVAGVTDIGVNRTRPEVGFQWTTIVDPTHRGRGLGMVLKTWNHHYLVEAIPEVKFLNTWNSASNSYMIAINEALGYQPMEMWTEYQLDLEPSGQPSQAAPVSASA